MNELKKESKKQTNGRGQNSNMCLQGVEKTKGGEAGKVAGE